VGAGGVEPRFSSVSAKPREPLCYTPFSQVTPTVEAKGKRSLDVQLNALFGTGTPPLLHELSTSRAQSHCMRRAPASIHRPPTSRACQIFDLVWWSEREGLPQAPTPGRR
jgi:hypothetical protein